MSLRILCLESTNNFIKLELFHVMSHLLFCKMYHLIFIGLYCYLEESCDIIFSSANFQWHLLLWHLVTHRLKKKTLIILHLKCKQFWAILNLFDFCSFHPVKKFNCSIKKFEKDPFRREKTNSLYILVKSQHQMK